MTYTLPLAPLNPRHGIHEPTTGTPVREPGTIRRTVTTDMLRPDGVTGPLFLIGNGRDLRTASDGTAEVVGEASMRAEIDYINGRPMTAISTLPERSHLTAVIGQKTSSGFRAAMDVADPGLAAESSLLYMLLDDVPVTTLVSGYAVGANVRPDAQLPIKGSLHHHTRNMCAGFIEGGTIMQGLDADHRAPIVTGPRAPSLDNDDPLAWHTLAELPPIGMRRQRRLDLKPGVDTIRADVLFRDSYMHPDGVEIVIHEYTVDVSIDARKRLVNSCVAIARVLPWIECPGAISSATRIDGLPLDHLRAYIRANFTGVSTCTHLNDTLRSLQDIPALLELLDEDALIT